MSASDRLERHALVMAIWVPAAFLAAVLLRLGISRASGWWIAAGFALIILTFIGHIIINVMLRTSFTAGETALGGVGFASALLILLLVGLLSPASLPAGVFTMLGLGMGSMLAAVILYLLIAFGPRRTLEKFDVIRDNNPRPTSSLPHRGGRR